MNSYGLHQMSPAEAEFGKNLILGNLQARDQSRLATRAEKVPLPYRQTLTDDDEQRQHVLFPISGVVSIVHVAENGTLVEVALVGREGMIGLGKLFGGPRQPTKLIVQGEGEAIRIPLNFMADEFHRGGTLREYLLRYVNYRMYQLSQTAICNRLHTIEQRLARWILLISDRTGIDNLQVSQEFLSYMLGARRASVNEVVQRFKESGAIRHSRNRVEVADKQQLLERSCECYRVLTRALDATFESVSSAIA